MLLTQFNDIFFCCCLGLKTVCRQTKSQSRKGDNWKGDKRKVRRITLPRKKTFKKLICVLEPRFRILSLVFVESKHLKGQLDPPVCNVTLLDHQVVLNGLNKLVIFVFSRLVYLIQVKPWISFFHSICIHFEWTHAHSLRFFSFFFQKILLSESRFTSSGSLYACFPICQFCVRNIFREENLSNIEDMEYSSSKNVSTFLSKLMIIAFLEQEHGPRNLVYKQEKKSFLQIPTLLSQNFINQSRPSSHTRMFSRHTQGNLLTG